MPTPGTLVLALACLLAFGCSREASSDEPAAPAVPARKAELLVLAASSLTDAFKALEIAHEAKHPEVDVLLSLAASSAVALQIDQGGTGDVLATASEDHMQRLVKAGLIQNDAVFAYNELVVAVPQANPAKLETFEDLAKAERIVLGAPNVPIGQYSDALLERAGKELGTTFSDRVNSRVVSREANVRLVLAKVELGEADAAIVYRTDIRQGARAIEVPRELSERATYPIGQATRSKQPELARAFIEHVLSHEGQAVLAKHKFIPARPLVSAAGHEP